MLVYVLAGNSSLFLTPNILVSVEIIRRNFLFQCDKSLTIGYTSFDFMYFFWFQNTTITLECVYSNNSEVGICESPSVDSLFLYSPIRISCYCLLLNLKSEVQLLCTENRLHHRFKSIHNSGVSSTNRLH